MPQFVKHVIRGKNKESVMIKKKILVSDRVRTIDGGFSFIPHRFVIDGFLSSLDPIPLLLYLFLSIVADRHGLSFYRYDSICTLLQVTVDQYINARNDLMEKDLIAFDGMIFQVLSLPRQTVKKPHARSRHRFDRKKPEPVGQIIKTVFKGLSDG
jgi:hypothetical protein